MSALCLPLEGKWRAKFHATFFCRSYSCAGFEVQHLEHTKPFMLREQRQVCIVAGKMNTMYPSTRRLYQLMFMYAAVSILFVLIQNNFGSITIKSTESQLTRLAQHIFKTDIIADCWIQVNPKRHGVKFASLVQLI